MKHARVHHKIGEPHDAKLAYLIQHGHHFAQKRCDIQPDERGKRKRYNKIILHRNALSYSA